MDMQAFLNEEGSGILRLGGARMALMDIEAGFWGLRRQMEALVGRQLTDNALQQAGANAGASFARTYVPDVTVATAESAFRKCVAAYQAAGFGNFEVEILQWPLGRVHITGRDTFEAWMMQKHGQEADQAVCVYSAGVLGGFVNALTGRKDVVCIQHRCQALGDEDCLFELLLASEAESSNIVSDDPDPGVIAQTIPPTRPQEVAADPRELSTLLDISQSIASTLELEPLLDLILDQFKALVAYDGAAVLTLDEDIIRVLAYRGPIAQEEALALQFPLQKAGINRLVIERRQPVIIPDVRDDAPFAQAFQKTAGDQLDTTFGYIRSWMGVPLISRDEVIGMLSLDHSQPNAYTRRHSLLARTFADKVAVAIENAYLYEQAEQAAASAERNRLARDLHDAVSQTLFSASLIAEVLPQLWEKNPAEGRRRLDELRELTRGALAEMRALLMELRPSTLAEFTLADLLRQLSEAAIGRSRLAVDLVVEGECPLPADVKIAFYRIAQEALHNIGKHAGASAVKIRLRLEPASVQLVIEDDGRGFDVADIPPNSLGVGIMRERAAKIGAECTIESRIGEGTTVAVSWRLPDEA